MGQLTLFTLFLFFSLPLFCCHDQGIPYFDDSKILKKGRGRGGVGVKGKKKKEKYIYIKRNTDRHH